jgi:cysteine synthase A
MESMAVAIFTGISGGASFAVALEVAAKAPAGSVILCLLADTGERYLTTPLFDGIAETMDEAEIRISKSTPGMSSVSAYGTKLAI